MDYTNKIIDLALHEDIGSGDHSSNSIFDENVTAEAVVKTKQKGVICGLEIAKKVFKSVDNELEVSLLRQDGYRADIGEEVLLIKGSARSILTAERTALNFLQRLSGIATSTANFTDAISGYKTVILDTRKTTPGWRAIEKYAVKTGGGENHRMGLYDMIMIKDNHIDFSGGIEQAIEKAKQYILKNKLEIHIVVEARNLEDVGKIVSVGGVFRILLDNFSVDTATQAVKMCQGKTLTEISGNVSLDNVSQYASTGVDFISVGSITHSFKSFDFTLLSKIG
ncbi:MAG: carboxylating nicotinate-nucleotide diphosphorylase [Chitinophagaceae bacterium]|nr:MAG: carboxylating nicotinate-nucleotide diphosphorylase [Chitinophagaceae bacterium]